MGLLLGAREGEREREVKEGGKGGKGGARGQGGTGVSAPSLPPVTSTPARRKQNSHFHANICKTAVMRLVRDAASNPVAGRGREGG